MINVNVRAKQEDSVVKVKINASTGDEYGAIAEQILRFQNGLTEDFELEAMEFRKFRDNSGMHLSIRGKQAAGARELNVRMSGDISLVLDLIRGKAPQTAQTRMGSTLPPLMRSVVSLPSAASVAPVAPRVQAPA